MTKFRFKEFQYEDFGRASLSDGLILALSTGLGKSLAAITWSTLKVGWDETESYKRKELVPKGKVLIIALGHLHGQLRDEWKRRFGINAIDLMTQDDYKRMTPLQNGFYLTTFTALSGNGVKEMPDPDDLSLGSSEEAMDELADAMLFYGVTAEEAKALHYKLPGDIEANIMQKARELCRRKYEQWSDGLSKEVGGIRCVYSPSLAELCRNDFDAVAIDEATKIKGENTNMGSGCRLMNPKYRLVLTATPVKNRLVDLFWLVHWATGGSAEPTPRFPYSNAPGEQEKFATEFMVTERNITKERAAAEAKGSKHYDPKKSKRRGTPTAEVCNIHKIWKLMAPNILRRRKQDIGEHIVGKTKHVVRVPMGKEQSEVYRFHLMADYSTASGEPCPLAQLQALRSAAAAPHSALLRNVNGYGMNSKYRAENEFTPKMSACMEVIADRLAHREQCVVFSPFHEPLDTISRRLDEAGIPHDVLDGRKTAKHRGEASLRFKGGWGNGNPVLLAGLGAMCEGHSWSKCNNVVLLAYDWAYDKFEQAINRVHRLDSEKEVNVYTIIADGTIDRRLESLIEEKGNAASLVLDGELTAEVSREVDIMELLRVAKEEFNDDEVIDEMDLEAKWPELKQKLRDAFAGTLVITEPREDDDALVGFTQAELMAF